MDTSVNLMMLPGEFQGEVMRGDEERKVRGELRRFYGRWRWAKWLILLGLIYDPLLRRFRRLEVVYGLSNMGVGVSEVAFVKFGKSKWMKVIGRIELW